MHPDIAYQLGEFRRADLIADADHHRLVNEARGARRPGGQGRPWAPRNWRRLALLGGAVAAE
jgi:hypothetical protein